LWRPAAPLRVVAVVVSAPAFPLRAHLFALIGMLHEKVVSVVVRVYPVLVTSCPIGEFHVSVCMTEPVAVAIHTAPFVGVAIGVLGMLHEIVVSVAVRSYPLLMVFSPIAKRHIRFSG